MNKENFTHFTLEYGSKTHVGLVRSDNQDFYGQFPPGERDLNHPNGLLFIVADGMGGHERGREASETAVRVIQENYYSRSTGDIASDLKRAIEAANQEIYSIAKSESKFVKMGTTCSSLVLARDRAYIGHVGDSRVYRINKDGIEQLTQDHTQVAEMYRKGILSKEEAKGHPSKSVLVRALGVNPEIEIDLLKDIKLEDGDYFIVCSDGLGKVTGDEIKEIVLRSTPQEACESLVDLANERGGHDNVTVQTLRVQKAESAAETEKVVQEDKTRKGWFRWIFLILIITAILWIGYTFLQGFINWFASEPDSNEESDLPRETLLKSENGELDPEITELLAEAVNLKQNGEWDAALQLYQKVLQKDPMNLTSINGIDEIAAAYHNQGNQLQNSQEYEAAISYYKKALDLQPRNQQLKNSILICQNALENPDLNLEPSVTNSNKDANKLTETVKDPVSVASTPSVEEIVLGDGYESSNWFFSGLSESDYVYNTAGINFFNNTRPKMAIYDKDYEDINVEVKAKIRDVNKNGKVGMVVGYQSKVGNEPITYFRFAVNGQENLTLEKMSGEKSEELLSIPFPSEDKDKSDVLILKVKCLGPWIMVYTNQKLLKAWLSKEFIRGKVGVFADPNKQVLFTDFKVSPAFNDDKELN